MWIPSPQQGDFLTECRTGTSNVVLIAVAGAGKTTTILKAVEDMRGNSIILSFNKKIAMEIEGKLKRAGIDWRKAQAKTMHGAGFTNYQKYFGKTPIIEDKVANLTGGWIESHKIDAAIAPHASVICKLVSLAKQNGIGIEGCGHIDDVSVWEDIVEHFDLFDEEALVRKADDIIDMSIQVLKESNQRTDQVDYDDMIYLTLLHDVPVFQYANVFVDEAQDTNTVRRLLAGRLMAPRYGRLFAVGDPRQAIYGFTGADNDSIELIKREFKAKEMPLTVTYRCPKNVVKFAQNWVSHIQAHESAPEGKVTMQTFEQLVQQPELLNGDAAILCRNTRPLVTAAFALIREKIPCRIEGRDIGDQLKKLATRWKSITTIPELEDKLIDWLEKERERWLPKKKMAKIQEAEDKFETLKVIMDACMEDERNLINDVVVYIERIFSDNVSGILTLSTIHKSKGREWPRVFWLDRLNTCPSKYAKQEWEMEQEFNLCYVATTRSMGELVDLFPPLPKVKPVNDNKLAAEKAA